MDKLLMIADDLTGALDAGVMLAQAGIQTRIALNETLPHVEPGCVLVTVAETRHVDAREAYSQVRRLAEQALEQDFTCIYKKTDSALRGNPGAELAAVRDAAGGGTVHFVPALPKMNRITRQGIQYIDGTVPVSESVFARDPLNPVRSSRVSEILGGTTDTPVRLAESGVDEDRPGIAVYDAATREDILRIGQDLARRGQTRLLAGCAGLAEVLPHILELSGSAERPRLSQGKLAVFCGSVNPISQTQYLEARDRGAPLLRLRLDEEPGLVAQRMADCIAAQGLSILATDPHTPDDPHRVARRMGAVIRETLHRSPACVPFIIGGDTLMAFIRAMDIRTLVPRGELAPGVVLAGYCDQGNWHDLISKSGGFGEPDLLMNIYALLNQTTSKTGGCI